ncbi:Mechanosensitive ion channel [Curtobacterium sp. 314Chir4.1]|uniref:mechanosensitive ion channel family protein n=1 Tax=Curtobacterium sp. 314Chir4.1 TaxID=1279028 RepID=UPI000BC6DB77|nr:mechanosensitive ion channel family protein [Curtobacterium sp. 314Chir4.1]SOC86917.1 Mechanosensitive ion channel [Curtobacterium sp. 314Chir4.1]
MQDLINNLLKKSSFDWWDVALAAVVVVVGWLASGWGRRGTRKLLERWSGMSAEMTNLLSRAVRYAILLLTIGVVLSILGAPLQPVLAAVIIVATVAVLALRGIASNFGAGIVIQARRPVRMGDTIEVDGWSGRIVELSGRTVLLHTSDGRTVRLPNTMLLQQPLVNASESGSVRSEIWVRITTPVDADTALTLVETAVAEVVPQSGRQLLLETDGPEQVDLCLRFWCTYDEREELRSASVREISSALSTQGHVGWVSSRRLGAVEWVRNSPAPPDGSPFSGDPRRA